MGIKILVAITLLLSLLLWTARLRHGLSLRKLWCVVRSSVPCTSLKSISSRITRTFSWDAPLPEAVEPLQVQTGAESDQAQVLDIPVLERLRRLCWALCQ